MNDFSATNWGPSVCAGGNILFKIQGHTGPRQAKSDSCHEAETWNDQQHRADEQFHEKIEAIYVQPHERLVHYPVLFIRSSNT